MYLKLMLYYNTYVFQIAGQFRLRILLPLHTYIIYKAVEVSEAEIGPQNSIFFYIDQSQPPMRK